MNPRTRPLALALALPVVLLLSAIPASASPPTWDFTDLFARGWSLLSAFWTDGGGSLDPNGPCGTVAVPAPIFGEEGCSLDPHGRCGVASAPAQVFSDAGCSSIDPNGYCQQ